jgi:hypothetical protein
MPTDDSSVKVLDTFIAVGKGAQAPADVLVWWPAVELTTPQRALLEATQRADSATSAAPRAGSRSRSSTRSTRNRTHGPITLDEPTSSGESVRLLAAQSSDALADWRGRAATGVHERQEEVFDPLCPNRSGEALNVDTGAMQREGWSQAARLVLGRLPGGRAASRTSAAARGDTLAVHSARWSCSRAPCCRTIDQTLVVAERFRSSLMGRRDAGPAHWQFSGKDEHDQPLEGHGHAYFLPRSPGPIPNDRDEPGSTAYWFGPEMVSSPRLGAISSGGSRGRSPGNCEASPTIRST